jgi:hypothetical protein
VFSTSLGYRSHRPRIVPRLQTNMLLLVIVSLLTRYSAGLASTAASPKISPDVTRRSTTF